MSRLHNQPTVLAGKDKKLDKAALSSLGERTFDQVITAIKAGETEQSLDLAARMHNELLGMRDLYVNWIIFLFSFIRDNYGDDDVEKVKVELLEYCAGSDPDYGPIYASMNSEERLQLVETFSLPNGIQENDTDQIALDQLITAIKSGEKQKALDETARVHDELFGLHGLYLVWITFLCTYIGRDYGNDDIKRAMEELMRHAITGDPEFGLAYVKMNDKERLELLAGAMRGHSYPLEIIEKEDCYDFIIEDCGSGGRLIKRGVYEGPDALYKVKGPSPMTYGQNEYPVYCTHCYFTAAISPIGCDEPISEFIASDRPGYSPCIVRLPKQKA